VPTYDRSKYGPAADTAKGGYIFAEAPSGKPDVILIGTGSELSTCVSAYEKLVAEGVQARVVSMPCWEWFDAQEPSYREKVLPSSVTARVACEAGIKQGWEKYLGDKGLFIGMSTFGASAPYTVLYKHFGITPEAVVAAAKSLVK
jgi:transketolase